jgi:hypothetical protein
MTVEPFVGKDISKIGIQKKGGSHFPKIPKRKVSIHEEEIRTVRSWKDVDH